MREIKDIVDEINNSIDLECKFWNIASLQEKDGVTFPLVNLGNGKGEKLSIESNYPLQIYHRILDSETETDYELGKGRFPYTRRIYSMRLVCTGNVKKLTGYDQDVNDKTKNDVYVQLNKKNFLSQKEIIRTTNENVNKTEVLGDEFSGADLDKLSLNVIAFYIEYEINQLCLTKQ